ncbi:MAG: hypothetical protein PHW04_13510 [Candidatus Wallbacteria bacterium]|nr:hypothetical protein [Candidatus Wallbacteria bacterium]
MPEITDLDKKFILRTAAAYRRQGVSFFLSGIILAVLIFSLSEPFIQAVWKWSFFALAVIFSLYQNLIAAQYTAFINKFKDQIGALWQVRVRTAKETAWLFSWTVALGFLFGTALVIGFRLTVIHNVHQFAPIERYPELYKPLSRKILSVNVANRAEFPLFVCGDLSFNLPWRSAKEYYRNQNQLMIRSTLDDRRLTCNFGNLPLIRDQISRLGETRNLAQLIPGVEHLLDTCESGFVETLLRSNLSNLSYDMNLAEIVRSFAAAGGKCLLFRDNKSNLPVDGSSFLVESRDRSSRAFQLGNPGKDPRIKLLIFSDDTHYLEFSFYGLEIGQYDIDFMLASLDYGNRLKMGRESMMAARITACQEYLSDVGEMPVKLWDLLEKPKTRSDGMPLSECWRGPYYKAASAWPDFCLDDFGRPILIIFSKGLGIFQLYSYGPDGRISGDDELIPFQDETKEVPVGYWYQPLPAPPGSAMEAIPPEPH